MTCKDGFDLEVAAYAPDVELRLTIARDRRPRHDLESLQLGKIVDDLLGDTVAQVLSGRIVVGVRERKQGKRVVGNTRRHAPNGGGDEGDEQDCCDEQR